MIIHGTDVADTQADRKTAEYLFLKNLPFSILSFLFFFKMHSFFERQTTLCRQIRFMATDAAFQLKWKWDGSTSDIVLNIFSSICV